MAIDNIESKDNHSGLSEGKKEISEVRHTTADKTLDVLTSKENPYEGMKKVQIEVNGESKELYIDNENFKLDSSNWKETEIDGIKVKINPEGDVIEYLEGAVKGEQLFSQYAGEREGKKIGKRLPSGSIGFEYEEFLAIIEKVGVNEFRKVFPGGSQSYLDRKFEGTGYDATFWCCSENSLDNNDYKIYFPRNFPTPFPLLSNKSNLYSVRLVKDID